MNEKPQSPLVLLANAAEWFARRLRIIHLAGRYEFHRAEAKRIRQEIKQLRAS